MSRSRLLLLCTALLTSWCDVTSGECPWLQSGLERWSNISTWPQNTLPGFESEVVITGKVLLDMQPPALSTIRVEAGGSLVWGDVDGLVLNVTYIHVLGSLHIGSQDCRFTKRATINLYGLSNSVHKTEEFAGKFVGVDDGGTLEVHGEDKLPWTKLAHTVPAARDVPCAALYDHQTSTLGLETKAGLHVMVWNGDGSVRDFNVFTTANYDSLHLMLDNLPDDVVIAAAVRVSIPTRTESALQALETLGSNLIRSVEADQRFAFIVQKGVPSSVREAVDNDDVMHLFHEAGDLHFEVASMSARVNFRVLDGEVARPKITLVHSARSWRVGDAVVVTSTDYDWRQAEVKHLVECTDCADNQIRLDEPFQYMHYGEITYNVDERAEVALLTRNILFEGQLEESCYFFTDFEQLLCDRFQEDMYGGHVKAVMGSTIHVEGAEFYHMGQQHIAGAYPLHLHMMDNGTGTWLRNNSIHDSRTRCITVHATHNVEVSDNVCYLHRGHGYFLEDGVEQNNSLHHNLGVGTLNGNILLSDRKREWCTSGAPDFICDHISTFWLTHPNNRITDNVAAGSDGHGFQYLFPSFPLGTSKNVPWIANDSDYRYHPLHFNGNSGHSNAKAGLFFDSQVSDGEYFNGDYLPENGVVPSAPNYDPRDPPNEDGVPVWAEMCNLTFYRNGVFNLWVKGGNIRVCHASLADSLRGFSGGTSFRDTGTEITHSLFVGETDNHGEPGTFKDRAIPEGPTVLLNHSFVKDPYQTVVGVEMYQGPMIVDTCHFIQYRHKWWADHWEALYGVRPVRPAAALSVHRTNIYPTSPNNYVNNVTFDLCDNEDDVHWYFHGNASTPGWVMGDGQQQLTMHDKDGSLTGWPGSQAVLDRPFFTGPHCRPRPDWTMTVCPYKYVQVEVMGRGGVLDRPFSRQHPLIIHRDDVPHDTLHLEGTQRNRFLLRTHKSYTININTSLSTIPKQFNVYAFNLERGDVLRVGLCLAADTTQFRIRGQYPNITSQDPAVFVDSLQKLDMDTSGRAFFRDISTGMLYFKFVTNETRQNNTEACANGECPMLKIERLDGSDNRSTPCSNNPPIADTTPDVPSPTPKSCNGGTGTGQGLGAPIRDLVTADPFTITCPAVLPVPGRLTPEFRGCFTDKSGSNSDVTDYSMDSKAMTRAFCQNRCYYRAYRFAALTVGKRCTCGDWFGLYGPVSQSQCAVSCMGQPSETCGDKLRLEVYTTGLSAPKPPPQRCGPGQRGVRFGEVCLYLQLHELTVSQAQRLCIRLGGNLIAILSQDKQEAVEAYLREHHPNIRDMVWTGLNQARRPSHWEQRDGTPLGFTSWRQNHGQDSRKHFVYLSGKEKYKWLQTGSTTTAHPLCDLPLSLPALERCGHNQQGLRLEPSGPCYLLSHLTVSQVQANYTCHMSGGLLASADDLTSEMQLMKMLYRLGQEQSYWVSKLNEVLTWRGSVYNLTKVTKSSKAGAVCILESTDNMQDCFTGWMREGQSCYLDLGEEVNDYSSGASRCETEDGASHLVSVESAAENSFLQGLAGSSDVLLGLRYTPRYDAFAWRSGELTASFSPWDDKNGHEKLVRGSCAVLKGSTGLWENAKCHNLLARVICEMPLITG
ncbi:cell surface hyaluronidase CEMIP2-like [Babylonia areolata]|uniref:cell surface hyaluronidase CEMIP2-like n=1 Tax=Babylonia areolata TaxID=304850 RepID=UPI003FD37B15